jgi:uncharacterized protein (DUF1810 family)
MAEVDLQRFVDAQHSSFDRALSEIEAGRKQSHWMWYVFPQISGLGLSSKSVRYAIGSVEEATAFLEHPILGVRYRQIVDAVWHHVVEGHVTIHNLFGSPDDSKLVSSLTLFEGVADDCDLPEPDIVAFVTKADQVLQAAYAEGIAPCADTDRFLVT